MFTRSLDQPVYVVKTVVEEGRTRAAEAEPEPRKLDEPDAEFSEARKESQPEKNHT